MKIEEVLATQKLSTNALTPMQKRVLGFFKQRRGEVFPYNDEVIAKALPDLKPTAIDWSIWRLHQLGLLAKAKVGRRVYFGLPDAIRQLESQLRPRKR